MSMVHELPVLPEVSAGRINPALLCKPWPAKWIACPGCNPDDYGVYLFRKTFDLAETPQEFLVHVSADNRYILHVNGVCTSRCPARGYLQRWNFCSLDIAGLLKPGTNVIAALVWNFAGDRPVAQISAGTGFLLQGNSAQEAVVNTGSSWHVTRDESRTARKVELNQYYIAGSGEEFHGDTHPWGWTALDFDDQGWQAAVETETAKPVACHGEYGTQPEHLLSAQEIPPMEETPQRFARIRRCSPGLPGLATQGFVEGTAVLVIPPDTRVTLLFDQDVLTTAYPVLRFSGGKNSRIKLTWAESLVDDQGGKGRRDEVENKHISGVSDLIHCDGGRGRTFQTLFWRTFRYVEMDISTAGEALELEDFHSLFSAYPLAEKARFASGDAQLSAIWNIGWRTQRLCAHETFMDTPYYEQLQYIGDARIQALISTCVSGDPRLTRTAISAIQASFLPMGLTQSRYPSAHIQVIPTFSLVWITMVHDYWMFNADQDFVFSLIPDMLKVLNWFEAHLQPNGMMGPVEWWAFVDWVDFPGWDGGNPPGAHTGNSAMLGLQFVYTLHKAAEIFSARGFLDLEKHCLGLARRVKHATFDLCFDQGRYLLADTPDKKHFSQHTNILALLADAFPASTDKVKVLEILLEDEHIAQATLYFKYYLFEALQKTAQASRFVSCLGPWKKMIESGLTAFAETPDPTRSDCHAWSASPVYYFLSLIAGIRPGSPGFATVHIEPQPGGLKRLDAAMPHPAGMTELRLDVLPDGRLSGEIRLPDQVPGVLVWQGKQKKLKPGLNLLA